jgi:hypothetical protein
MPSAAAFLCLALVAHGAAKQTNATARPSITSSAMPAATEIPRSVFVLPRNPSEGRDPFFPHTSRLSGARATETKTVTNKPPAVIELALKGISGTRDRPLAIINTTTFGVGDENDVITGTRRVRVHCVGINVDTGTVIVQIGNERRELRLKQPK